MSLPASEQVARVWTARATPENVTAYRAHFERAVLPALRTLDGFSGAQLLTRADGTAALGAPIGPRARALPGSVPTAGWAQGDAVEVVVITYWRTMDAVCAFAGEYPERAVVAPDARALLVSWDHVVRHFECRGYSHG